MGIFGVSKLARGMTGPSTPRQLKHRAEADEIGNYQADELNKDIDARQLDTVCGRG